MRTEDSEKELEYSLVRGTQITKPKKIPPKPPQRRSSTVTTENQNSDVHVDSKFGIMISRYSDVCKLVEC